MIVEVYENNVFEMVTLEMPVTLKTRLEHFAAQQGVSMNNLANELLVD
jgi:hypothetical protein